MTLAVTLLLTGVPGVQADTNINFSGTLLDGPQCTVNNGSDINVSFGTDMIISQVNGRKL